MERLAAKWARKVIDKPRKRGVFGISHRGGQFCTSVVSNRRVPKIRQEQQRWTNRVGGKIGGGEGSLVDLAKGSTTSSVTINQRRAFAQLHPRTFCRMPSRRGHGRPGIGSQCPVSLCFKVPRRWSDPIGRANGSPFRVRRAYASIQGRRRRITLEGGRSRETLGFLIRNIANLLPRNFEVSKFWNS